MLAQQRCCKIIGPMHTAGSTQGPGPDWLGSWLGENQGRSKGPQGTPWSPQGVQGQPKGVRPRAAKITETLLKYYGNIGEIL